MNNSEYPTDAALIDRAIANAASVRGTTAPNPWVGAVVLTQDGEVFDGATRPAGGPHAERIALEAAGQAVRGATLATTLEPCCHSSRTDPCVDHIIEAGEMDLHMYFDAETVTASEISEIIESTHS